MKAKKEIDYNQINTYSATVSSGVQDEKSAFDMNFLFIGVSSVTLSHKNSPTKSNLVNLITIRVDNVERRRRYSDHFVTMCVYVCVCVCVCMLAR